VIPRASLFLSILFLACSADRPEQAPSDTGLAPTDGFSLPDGEVNDGNTGCASGQSEARRVPVDLIFAIDQSESMDGEIAQVKKNINKLTDLLGATKLDYRVVMIARPGPDTFGVCIPPPLGAEGCGDNLPRFKRSAQVVMSNDALALYLKTYDSTDPLLNWSKYIRVDSFKAFVPITDDNATQPPPAPYWQTFDREILKRGSGTFGKATDRNYAFFPIIGATSLDPTQKCSTEVISVGEEYQGLVKLTGGTHFPVCATDYGPIFTAMAQEIAGRVLCTLPIPANPKGEVIDPARVNVSYTPSAGGAPKDLVQDSSKACNEGANGWQYNADKTKILLCGDACKVLRDDPGTRVDVVFGCKTRVL